MQALTAEPIESLPHTPNSRLRGILKSHRTSLGPHKRLQRCFTDRVRQHRGALTEIPEEASSTDSERLSCSTWPITGDSTDFGQTSSEEQAFSTDIGVAQALPEAV